MLLNGIAEICKYMGLSETTVIDLIQKENLPAKLSEESTWQAESDEIDTWGNGGKSLKRKNVPVVEAKTEAAVKADLDAKIGRPAKKAKYSGGKK